MLYVVTRNGSPIAGQVPTTESIATWAARTLQSENPKLGRDVFDVAPVSTLSTLASDDDWDRAISTADLFDDVQATQWTRRVTALAMVGR